MTHLSFCSLLALLSVPVAAQTLLDPTKPVAGVVKSSDTQPSIRWVLESVVRKNGQFKAIISGTLYVQGQQLGDYEIARIDASSVLLNQGTKQVKLKLYGDDIKH